MSEIPLSSVTDLLFVYGTLMQGFQNEFANYLHRSSFRLGSGCIRGLLYQIDWFPGALYDPTSQTHVWGEIYQLQDPVCTLAYLDQYEGIYDNPAPFIRRVIPVSMGNQTLDCQVYLYNGSTDKLRLINSGRFRDL